MLLYSWPIGAEKEVCMSKIGKLVKQIEVELLNSKDIDVVTRLEGMLRHARSVHQDYDDISAQVDALTKRFKWLVGY